MKLFNFPNLIYLIFIIFWIWYFYKQAKNDNRPRVKPDEKFGKLFVMLPLIFQGIFLFMLTIGFFFVIPFGLSAIIFDSIEINSIEVTYRKIFQIIFTESLLIASQYIFFCYALKRNSVIYRIVAVLFSIVLLVNFCLNIIDSISFGVYSFEIIDYSNLFIWVFNLIVIIIFFRVNEKWYYNKPEYFKYFGLSIRLMFIFYLVLIFFSFLNFLLGFWVVS